MRRLSQVFALHTPWWSYYYIHNAVPTSWCAVLGYSAMFKWASRQRTKFPTVAVSLFTLSAAIWMVTRIGLQVNGIRRSPQTFNSIILQEIARYKPHAKFMFSEEGAYSFHSGIPMVPKLGVVSLKRFWSGELTTQGLAEILRTTRPEIIMIASDTRPRSFQDLLFSDYSLAFEDAAHRLYVRRDVTKLVVW